MTTAPHPPRWRSTAHLTPVPIRVVAPTMPVPHALAQAEMRFASDTEVSDSAAVTLAEAFAAPGRPALAAFAAGEVVHGERVLDDIFDARQQAVASGQKIALDMLGTFVLAKMREAVA